MSKISYICQECGKEFTAYKSKKRKYCSKKCFGNYVKGDKHHNYKEKIKLNCQYCNKEFKVHISGKNRKYCSVKCANIVIGKQKKKTRIELICQNCNKKYKSISSQVKRSKYCSVKCQNEYQKELYKGKDNPHFGYRKYTDLEYKNWQEYRNKVRAKTYVNYKLYEDKINPKKLKIGKKKYHLDHKYSIHDGFYNDIPIDIISHQYNLQILTCKENLKKNSKSCILLNDLEDKITKNRS